MAPYWVSLPEVAARFGTSPKRRSILRGYLRHREALRGLGIKSAVQYLDGSFVDKLVDREPRDIDVITFYIPPPGWNAGRVLAERPDVFDRFQSKHAFMCDALFINIALDPFETLSLTRFWYGLFSHSRSDEWRGLLAVSLSDQDEPAALSMLDSMEAS